MSDKDYDEELVPFVEICLFRNHDADETKLELRCNKAVIARTNEKTDEFMSVDTT